MMDTAAPRQSGFRRFLSLINLAAITAVMLAASGCHKDSLSLDEATRPTPTTISDDGRELPSSTGTPNIGISSSADTVQEDGGQIVVRVTSDTDAPEDGLAVMVSISGADAGEFTANAPCTADLVCTVTILEGNRVGDLVLTPIFDTAAETESWTATLEDGGDDYNFPADNDNADFDIVDTVAAIGLATTMASATEGGPIILMVTSNVEAPADGISVTVDISGADAAEFNADAAAVCTNLVCVVTILEGEMSVDLVLTPLSDFSTEPGERWTASLVDGSDYNLDANDNADFAIVDLIAVVGIDTGDTPAEGGAAVALTITSTLPAPVGGLTVTVDIIGANADDFDTNAAGCTDSPRPRCIVTILEGEMTVSLVLSPLSDFATEPGESWTAFLIDSDTYDPDTGNADTTFDITDLIAVVGIDTDDTPMEGGAAVILTISSTLPAPDGGLDVIINIAGADADEFTSGDCNGLVCEVAIGPTELVALLTITLVSDSAVEGGAENWVVRIAPDPNIFMIDPNADLAVLAVANMLPPVTEALRIVDLNAYTPPTPLSADAMRAGGNDDSGEPSRATLPITGFQYNDPFGNPRVLVERLDYAHLGIGINGNIDDADFVFAPLNENVVTAPASASNLGDATYALEGEMTYNGNRFYPDGELVADFINAQVSGEISLDGQEAADDFGGTTLADGTTAITNIDNLTLGLSSVADSLGASGFSGALDIITAEGFFSSLSGISTGTYSGRFNDAASYIGAAAPQEVSGSFGDITDANGNALNGGFLGQCSAGCDPPDSVGISSALIESREDGDVIVLVITSSVDAPMGGLEVNINIDGADPADFTANAEADCIFPICTVTILEFTDSVNLELTPVDDSADEPTETWTATVIGGGDFIPDPVDNAVSFNIVDTPFLPAVSPDTTLANLLEYAVDSGNMPVELVADDIRAGVDATTNVGTIVGARYNDAAGLPQIYVQRVLERGFAHLGIWVSGKEPTPGDSDHDDFRYASLADNAVSNLPSTGIGQYFFEADATYKGVNFFPDGNLVMNFGANNFRGSMDVEGSQGANGADYFGVGGTLPDGTNPSAFDSLSITYEQADGTINLDGTFSGSWTIPIATAADAPTGFFSDLAGATGGTIGGRFYHSSGYNPMDRDPFEIAGSGMITDSAMNELRFGFLGSCVIPMSSFCGPGNTNIVTPNIITP